MKLSHRIHGTGIFTYMWWIFTVNVGKYTIHGSYGCMNFIRKSVEIPHRKCNESRPCQIGVDDELLYSKGQVVEWWYLCHDWTPFMALVFLQTGCWQFIFIIPQSAVLQTDDFYFCFISSDKHLVFKKRMCNLGVSFNDHMRGPQFCALPASPSALACTHFVGPAPVDGELSNWLGIWWKSRIPPGVLTQCVAHYGILTCHFSICFTANFGASWWLTRRM